MTKRRKNTSLAKQEALERALQAENVVDMELFFDARKKDSSEYWLSGMILILDHVTTEQKIKLAHKVIKDEDVLAFFFRQLYGMDDELV
ncbi:MAG: hypothetical protein J6Y91_04620 [Alphaproteobacteria bacterium]|nr:hypothetical protein [Alphaproteobacteria bacterium]